MKLAVSVKAITLSAAISATLCFVPHAQAQQADATIPDAPRELRAAWITTVYNGNWPSKPGLPVAQQQQELIAILDKAKAVNLNAVVFQVRPGGDAMYDSKLEPWSEYLTGRQGQAPQPYYDPLSFAVEEAHKRGMQLHAWFNPYRAATRLSGAFTDNHVSKTMPEATVKLDKLMWLDPGSKRAQDHSIAVIMDVVRRYDIDGVQFDDYFYPYSSEVAKVGMDSLDDGSWKQYQAAGGPMSRDDWRRENVNTLMRRVYESIKQTKPRVYFGISPFGIWRPGYPAGIAGLDAYNSLYADARKWLQEGWLDYCSPQLYWELSKPAQSYPKLLAWWVEQNAKGRHIWPGISITGVGSEKTPTDDVLARLDLTRKQPGATGVIYFSSLPLLKDQGQIATRLKQTAYATPALVPPSPWLDNTAPAALVANVVRDVATGSMALQWAVPQEADAFLVTIYARVNNAWQFDIVPAATQGYKFASTGAVPDMVAVSVVDRMGNESPKQSVSLRGDTSISIPAPVTAPALPGSR